MIGVFKRAAYELAEPGDFTMIYGSTGQDSLTYVCPCGEHVTLPLDELSGWEWHATEAEPQVTSVEVESPCGWIGTLDG